MKSQMFVPDRIKVGFKLREDTYQGKLAYVIYYDKKGVLRKEASFKTWCNPSIPAVEFVNKPTEGFVLNKKVGGIRSGWNHRQEYIRVYDPRDIEFEITVPNLLFILANCDCSRGKGLEGKFVYAWSGDKLVLLPENCQEYKESLGFTELQEKSVKFKEMILGAKYLTKRQESWVYLGRLDYYFLCEFKTNRMDIKGKCKIHVFWDGKFFHYKKDLKSIAKLEDTTVSDQYAEALDKYYKSIHGSRAVELHLKKEGSIYPTGDVYCAESWFYKDSDNQYVCCETNFGCLDRRKMESVSFQWAVSLKDGLLGISPLNAAAYPKGGQVPFGYGYNPSRDFGRIVPWIEPTTDRLYVKLESGAEFKFDQYAFSKSF